MPPEPTVDHRLDDAEGNVHVGVWNNDLEPVLSIESGDVVEFECRDATNGALDADATAADLETMSFEGHPLTGPVRIEGAEMGDVLAVEFLSFEHRGYGVTYFYPEEAERACSRRRSTNPDSTSGTSRATSDTSWTASRYRCTRSRASPASLPGRPATTARRRRGAWAGTST